MSRTDMIEELVLRFVDEQRTDRYASQLKRQLIHLCHTVANQMEKEIKQQPSDLTKLKQYIDKDFNDTRDRYEQAKNRQNWANCMVFDAQLNQIKMLAVILNLYFDETFDNDWLNKIYELDVD